MFSWPYFFLSLSWSLVVLLSPPGSILSSLFVLSLLVCYFFALSLAGRCHQPSRWKFSVAPQPADLSNSSMARAGWIEIEIAARQPTLAVPRSASMATTSAGQRDGRQAEVIATSNDLHPCQRPHPHPILGCHWQVAMQRTTGSGVVASRGDKGAIASLRRGWFWQNLHLADGIRARVVLVLRPAWGVHEAKVRMCFVLTDYHWRATVMSCKPDTFKEHSLRRNYIGDDRHRTGAGSPTSGRYRHCVRCVCRW